MKYGDPDEENQDRLPQMERSFVVWRYFKNREATYFVFTDEKGLGEYTLIMSDDPTEISDPSLRKDYGADWEYIMETIYR